MTVKLPKQNIWKQVNHGNKFGDLWSSYNLDLTKKIGSLLISSRLLLNVATTDLANLTTPPCAFKFFTGGSPDIWTASGARLFKTSTGGPNDTFAQVTGTPTTLNSNQTDLQIFNGNLFVTGATTNVYRVDTGETVNTIANGVANSSGLHAMTVLRSQNKLYIVDDNAAGITSIDTSNTPVLSTSGAPFSLDDLVEGAGVNVGSYISCITSNSTRVWIGTINQGGNECKVYAWDGSQASGPNEFYLVKAGGILAIIVQDDVPVIFTTDGKLMKLNGGTFIELDKLPFENQRPKLPVSTATNRMCHYNGMDIIDGRINIFINAELYDTNSTIKENVPSGIWEYTPETGLYHKASVGHTKSGGTIVDYGQQKLSLIGALASIEIPSTSVTASALNGRYLVGCDYFTDATTATTGIFYDDTNDTLQKAGYFVISRQFSENITETWQKFYLRFRKFLNSTDKIVVKAKTEEDEPTEATITYINTTSFTVTASDFDTNPAVGDEVEILQGVGAGRTMHITAVTGTTTLTITVDETITGATTQTAIARFQTWKKLGSYNAQIDDFFKLSIDLSLVGSTPWIQIKVWVLWTDKNEIYDSIISSRVHEKIE